MAKTSNIDYQKRQYFISDSKQDMQTISNKKDSKLFKNKELPLPQRTGLQALTTPGALNHLPRKLKVLNGSTVTPLKEKKSVTLQSPLPLSHKQSTSLSIQYPIFQPTNLKTVKTGLSLNIKYKQQLNSSIMLQSLQISLVLHLIHGMPQQNISNIFTEKKNPFFLK